MSYFSFLLCCRDNQTDIYYNGLPVGQIINNEFKLHQFKLSNGSIRALTLEDLAHPCPFGDIEELKERIIEFIGKIKIEKVEV